MKLNYLKDRMSNDFIGKLLTKEQVDNMKELCHDFLDKQFIEKKSKEDFLFVETIIERLETIEEVIVFSMNWDAILDNWMPKPLRLLKGVKNSEDALELLENAMELGRNRGLVTEELESEYESLINKLQNGQI